jgi:hypothetical protein
LFTPSRIGTSGMSVASSTVASLGISEWSRYATRKAAMMERPELSNPADTGLPGILAGADNEHLIDDDDDEWLEEEDDEEWYHEEEDAGESALKEMARLAAEIKAGRANVPAGWRLERPKPGVLVWTTPSGRRYASTTAGDPYPLPALWSLSPAWPLGSDTPPHVALVAHRPLSAAVSGWAGHRVLRRRRSRPRRLGRRPRSRRRW